MIRHIVMWKFRSGTEAEQAQFLEGLRGLQGVIPQLLKSEVAVNVGEGNYDAVLVSDFIFADAGRYDQWTEAYRKGLAHVDQVLAKRSDTVVEVCSGNIILHKGELPR